MAELDITERKVFVGGLRQETTQEVVATYYSQYGEVEEVKIINDRQTGRSKGYGFVTFRTSESARAAVLTQNPIIDGKQANCNLAAEGKNGSVGGTGVTGKRKFDDVNGGYSSVSKAPKFDHQQQSQYAAAAAAAAVGFPMGMLGPMSQPFMYPQYSQSYGQSASPPAILPTSSSSSTQPTLSDVMTMLQTLRAEVQQLRAEIAPLVASASQSIQL